jgi:hypothetical protein
MLLLCKGRSLLPPLALVCILDYALGSGDGGAVGSSIEGLQALQ